MSSKNNIKLTIIYDGTGYLGYQDNRMGKTIESILKSSIEKILREKIILQAASRTDRGVHANGQIVNFYSHTSLSLNKLIFRLNQLLPKDIRVISADVMPLEFHPTLDAKSKTYLYYINTSKVQSPHMNQFSWHIFKDLNIEKMKEAAKFLIGSYDFTSFTNCFQENSVREIIDIQLIYKTPLLTFKIKGVSFLYKMVRNIVGTLIYIGLEKFKISEINDILHAKDRKKAGPTAPAYGLFLDKIEY